jgi:hypothetical protein
MKPLSKPLLIATLHVLCETSAKTLEKADEQPQ